MGDMHTPHMSRTVRVKMIKMTLLVLCLCVGANAATLNVDTFAFTNEPLYSFPLEDVDSILISKNMTLANTTLVAYSSAEDSNFRLQHDCTSNEMHVVVENVGVYNNASATLISYEENNELVYTSPTIATINMGTVLFDKVANVSIYPSPEYLFPVHIAIRNLYFIGYDATSGRTLTPTSDTAITSPEFSILRISYPLPPRSTIIISNLSFSAPRACSFISVLSFTDSAALTYQVEIVVQGVRYPAGIAYEEDNAYAYPSGSMDEYACSVVRLSGSAFYIARRSNFTIQNVSIGGGVQSFRYGRIPVTIITDVTYYRYKFTLSRKMQVMQTSAAFHITFESGLFITDIALATHLEPSAADENITSTGIIFLNTLTLTLTERSTLRIANFSLQDATVIARFKTVVVSNHSNMLIAGDYRIQSQNLLNNALGVGYDEGACALLSTASSSSPTTDHYCVNGTRTGVVSVASHTLIQSLRGMVFATTQWTVQNASVVEVRGLFLHTANLQSTQNIALFSTGGDKPMLVEDAQSHFVVAACNVTGTRSGSAVDLRDLTVQRSAQVTISAVHMINATAGIEPGVAIVRLFQLTLAHAARLAVENSSLVSGSGTTINATFAADSDRTARHYGVVLLIKPDSTDGFITVDAYSLLNISDNTVEAMATVTVFGEGDSEAKTPVSLLRGSRVVIDGNALRTLDGALCTTTVRLYSFYRLTASLDDFAAASSTLLLATTAFHFRAPNGSPLARPNGILIEGNSIQSLERGESLVSLTLQPIIQLGVESINVSAVPTDLAAAEPSMRTLVLSVADTAVYTSTSTSTVITGVSESYLVAGQADPVVGTDRMTGRSCRNNVNGSTTHAAVSARFGSPVIADYAANVSLPETCDRSLLAFWTLLSGTAPLPATPSVVSNTRTVAATASMRPSLSPTLTDTTATTVTATATVTTTQATVTPSNTPTKTENISQTLSVPPPPTSTTTAMSNATSSTTPAPPVAPTTVAPAPPPPQAQTFTSGGTSGAGTTVVLGGGIIIGAAPAAALAQSVAIVALMPCNVGESSQSNAMRLLITPLQLPETLGRLQYLLGSIVLVVAFAVGYYSIYFPLLWTLQRHGLRKAQALDAALLLLQQQRLVDDIQDHDDFSPSGNDEGSDPDGEAQPAEGDAKPKPSHANDDRCPDKHCGSDADANTDDTRCHEPEKATSPIDAPPHAVGSQKTSPRQRHHRHQQRQQHLVRQLLVHLPDIPAEAATLRTHAARELLVWWVDRPKVWLQYPRPPVYVFEVLLPGIVFEACTLLYGKKGVLTTASDAFSEASAGSAAAELIVAVVVLLVVGLFVAAQHVIAVRWRLGARRAYAALILRRRLHTADSATRNRNTRHNAIRDASLHDNIDGAHGGGQGSGNPLGGRGDHHDNDPVTCSGGVGSDGDASPLSDGGTLVPSISTELFPERHISAMIKAKKIKRRQSLAAAATGRGGGAQTDAPQQTITHLALTTAPTTTATELYHNSTTFPQTEPPKSEDVKSDASDDATPPYSTGFGTDRDEDPSQGRPPRLIIVAGETEAAPSVAAADAEGDIAVSSAANFPSSPTFDQIWAIAARTTHSSKRNHDKSSKRSKNTLLVQQSSPLSGRAGISGLFASGSGALDEEGDEEDDEARRRRKQEARAHERAMLMDADAAFESSGADGYIPYTHEEQCLLHPLLRPVLARGYWTNRVKRSRKCLLIQMHTTKLALFTISINDLRSIAMAAVAAIGSANASDAAAANGCAAVQSVVAFIAFAHAGLVLVTQCYRARFTNLLTCAGSLFVGLATAMTVDNNLFYSRNINSFLTNVTTTTTTTATVVDTDALGRSTYYASRADAAGAFAVLALVAAFVLAGFSAVHIVMEWHMRRVQAPIAAAMDLQRQKKQQDDDDEGGQKQFVKSAAQQSSGQKGGGGGTSPTVVIVPVESTCHGDPNESAGGDETGPGQGVSRWAVRVALRRQLQFKTDNGATIDGTLVTEYQLNRQTLEATLGTDK